MPGAAGTKLLTGATLSGFDQHGDAGMRVLGIRHQGRGVPVKLQPVQVLFGDCDILQRFFISAGFFPGYGFFALSYHVRQIKTYVFF